ncbi:CARDB domain-containing protein, partial [Nanoarchaeota archaeon]
LRCAIDYTIADTTKPTVTLQGPGDNTYTNNVSVEFSYIPVDNREFAQCQLVLDGALNATNTTAIINNSVNTISTNIAEGSISWNVNCTDKSGNTGIALTPKNIIVDRSPPGLFSITAPDNETVSSNLQPTFTWAQPTESNFRNYTILLDNNPDFLSPERVFTQTVYGTTSYTPPTNIPSNTKFYWKVITYDLAGNSRESTQIYIYTTDTNDPTEFTLTSPASGTISSSRIPSLDWGNTVETNFANYTVQVDDNSAFTGIDYKYTSYSSVGNSNYSIQLGEQLGADTLWFWRVIAYDQAGNSRTSTAFFNYTTDNTVPALVLEAPAPDKVESLTNNLEFNYTVTDTFSEVSACKLIINDTVEQTDGPISQGSTQTFDQFLDNGLYEWWINCTDEVGNTNESLHRFLEVSVFIDLTEPVVELNYPDPAAFINTTTITFNYTPQDASLIENCTIYIDGAENLTNHTIIKDEPNYFTISGFSQTTYDWNITCTDESNNKGASEMLSFTVDTNPPSAFSIVYPPNETVVGTENVTLNWSQTTENNFANYTVIVDNNPDFTSPEYTGIAITITTLNITTLPLAEDIFYWKVIAYDKAGNWQESSQTWEFEVHTHAPGIISYYEDPEDPVIFRESSTYKFNVTISEPLLDIVYFESDFSGPKINVTPTSNSTDGHNWTFFYQITGQTAGTYAYRWIAIDDFGRKNQTGSITYQITKNTTTTLLYIEGIRDNITINESDVLNLTGILNHPQGGLVTISENSTPLVQDANQANISRNFTVPGIYLINASYPGNANYTASSEAWHVTVLDNIASVVGLLSPDNETTDYDGILSFTFNVTDTGSLVNCSSYINGTREETKTVLEKGAPQSFSPVERPTGAYSWYVNCIDSAGNTGYSETRYLDVQILTYARDIIPESCQDPQGDCAVANINESNQGYEAHGTLDKSPGDNFVYVNITPENIRLGSTIDTLNITWEKYQATAEGNLVISWLNGSTWVDICNVGFTSSTEPSPDDVYCDITSYPSVEQLNDGLEVRGNFFYSGNPSGVIYGTDYVGLSIQYTEDATPPSMTLNQPPLATERGAGYFTFNYTPEDENLYNCTLYGDFGGSWQKNQTNHSPSDGVINSFSGVYLGPGFYYWNVLCYDIADNFAFALSNYTLNVTRPDLTIQSNDIKFSDNTPLENTNITVNVTVRNDGLTDSESFVVELFKGDPDSGGEQVNGNRTIISLAGLSNTTVSFNYTVAVGPNHLFARADPNNVIIEVKEDNNKANNTLDVPAYQFIYGNVTTRIVLTDKVNNSIVGFENTTDNNGTILIADEGTDIDFTKLYALGRTTAGVPTGDDFTEADIALGMQNFVDSLNNEWAGGTDIGTMQKDFFIARRTVQNVPYVNSSAAGTFITGILWDAGDDSQSNTEYDSVDNEDLIFVAELQPGTIGEFGVYDYEIKLPAMLRNYSGAGDTVTIYYQLE